MKKSEKPSIVRSTVMKADTSEFLKKSKIYFNYNQHKIFKIDSKLSEKSTVKSTISASDESSKSSEPRKKKIMDRLGDYIGEKAKSEGTKTWSSSKQVSIIKDLLITHFHCFMT